MHKKITQNKHIQIANNTMYYIYQHIDTDINLDELADNFGLSKVHFHKIFKEQMGRNIYETIKLIRLHKASNLLLTNTSSTITQIANMCGYSSQTSFIRAFKQRFLQTPKNWKNGGYKEYSNKILKDIEVNFDTLEQFNNIEPKIEKVKPMNIYYIRTTGYSKVGLKKVWQKIQAWIYTNNIESYDLIAFYHDNPVITPEDECFYVAGAIVKEEANLENTNLPHLTIFGGLYASFEIKGVHGDIQRLLQWVYQEWLPKSGFETTTSSPHTIFRQNHYLDESEKFEATFYFPIKFS